MSADQQEQPPKSLTRRDFLHNVGGALAGVAGLLGLGSANGLFEKPNRKTGYGSSPYGGNKES